MTADSYKRTPMGMLEDFATRIQGLERRLMFVPTTALAQGTTAERDLVYGVPATEAEEVALANNHALWFNDDLGWQEGYFAEAGSTGLLVQGLVSGSAPGWYPIGRGPKLVCNPTELFGATALANISGWDGEVWSVGGDAWIEYTGSGVITVKKPGRYRVYWKTVLQVGGGELDMWLYAGGAFANDAWELNGTIFKAVGHEFADIELAADATCYAYNNAGACNVHMSSSTRRGEFVVEYLSPPLVTAPEFGADTFQSTFTSTFE